MTTIFRIKVGLSEVKIEKRENANPFVHLLRLINIVAIGSTPFTEIV